MKTLKIRDLTLRDGQQSSFATRMRQEQIDRVLPYYKDAKFYAMEVWGGAVPDSVMRYLGENPWTRLETIHKAVGEVSKLTALSRGRNLFGYSPYTDEIIEGFSRNAIESGLGIMRIFDALNDVDNVKSTIKYVKQYGGIADCAVCYTIDPKYPKLSLWERLRGKKIPEPVFTDDYTVGKAKQMAALGADMITI
jgi:pyruvate carboxylase subunit B